MADLKISGAADGVTAVGTDKIPIARVGDTTAYYLTVTELLAAIGQGAAVEDATGTLADATTKINLIIARLEALGLLAA